METIYESIAARTGGNIYIGVVGPVRTGKSTFIKRIMEQLVIPNIDEPFRRERAIDELPQSGSGRTIMTSEPKFVPEEAVEISPDGTATLRIRMIDSVGYMVDGAVGAEEDGVPRMVTTPWYDHEIPLTDAAELGTKRVMDDHCSIGIVITTDGSVTDIPREDYKDAERRAIQDMQKTGKPYLVIINCTNPRSERVRALQENLLEHYGVNALPLDCQAMSSEDICDLFQKLLYAFPLQSLQVYLPRWMDPLPYEHPVKAEIYRQLLDTVPNISQLDKAQEILSELTAIENVEEVRVRSIDLGTGTVCCTILFPDSLFYNILSQNTGISITSDAQLLEILTQLSAIKTEYEKISDALDAAKATGYGIVMPCASEMKLETPELVKKGGSYGVKLKAGAPSIHMIRVDIDTEISPMVGDEQQSKDLIAYLGGEAPEKLWQSNIFGKSVYDLIQEGLSGKLLRTPDDVRAKLRGSLTKIVNEGANGMICILI